MKTIKTIFFDLGNVVIKVHPEILEKGLATHGKIKEGAIVDYFTSSDNLNSYQTGRLTSSRFYSKTRRFFRLDIKYNEFYRIWNSIFRPYPEMEDIISAIKKKYPDIRLILFSNTNESHYEYLKENYKILELFDAHVLSHEIGKNKPHPDIYKAALRSAGSIPRDTFYTDDRPELIEAARTIGIRAFTFTSPKTLRHQLSKYGIQV